jgi:hypothetical protein
MNAIIEAGTNVNHGRESGFTALFSAVISGHLKAVEILLGAGAEVVDMQGTKLAGYAQGKKRTQIVAALERAMQSK